MPQTDGGGRADPSVERDASRWIVKGMVTSITSLAQPQSRSVARAGSQGSKDLATLVGS